MIALTIGNASQAPSRFLWLEDMGEKSRLCFDRVRITYRQGSYFRNPAEALVFKESAWAMSGMTASENLRRALPLRSLEHPPVRCCYVVRSNGRNPSNVPAIKAAVLTEVQGYLRGSGGDHSGSSTLPVASRAYIEDVSPNENMSLAEQVRLFAACDVLVSPHGSQNANAIFMQPGSIFIELNMPKFYYFSYEAMAVAGGVRYVSSRHNMVDYTASGPNHLKGGKEPNASTLVVQMRAFEKLNDTRVSAGAEVPNFESHAAIQRKYI
jgi:hypothetical protein